MGNPMPSNAILEAIQRLAIGGPDRSGLPNQFQMGNQWFYLPPVTPGTMTPVRGFDRQMRTPPNGAIMIDPARNREI